MSDRISSGSMLLRSKRSLSRCEDTRLRFARALATIAENVRVATAAAVGLVFGLAIAPYATAQPSLEMDSTGASTASVPPVSTVTVTLRNNSNNPTGNTFTAFTPTVTATYTLKNQQYPMNTTSETPVGGALNLGGNTPVTGTSLLTSIANYGPLNGIGSPANTMLTSLPTITPGNGIDVTQNYGARVFTSARSLFNAGLNTPTGLAGRYYMGDLEIVFSRPIAQPLVHMTGLGGQFTSSTTVPIGGPTATFTLGFTTELELDPSKSTPGITGIQKLSGNSVFTVAGFDIANSAANPSASCASNVAACGSVQILGTGVTQLTFKLYLRGDGGVISGTNPEPPTPAWSSDPGHTGDAWYISTSDLAPVQVAGRVYRETGGNAVDNGNAIDPGIVTQLSIACTNPTYAEGPISTNADGTYSFPDVPASANCEITEDQPAGYTSAYNTPGSGATAGNNSTTITIASVPIAGTTGNNFAEMLSGVSVAGRVYREASTPVNSADDGNAVDPGLVTQVALSCAPSYTGTTPLTTNADGTYSFANVPAGASCTITETQPAGFTNAYNTPGTGGTGNTGGTAGSTGNSTITLTVPNTGSTGNNFAEQGVNTTSTTVCLPDSPVAPSASITCTVTCTNQGPGTALGMSCAVTNAASLPGAPTPTCSPSANVAADGTLTCTVGFSAPVNGSVTVNGGSSAANDINGGNVPTGGDNPSSATVSVSGVSVAGRVYREASTPANSADDGNAVDPGLVTQVALSCTPAYTGTTPLTTNADGTYSFANVPAGASCTITETQPAGFTNAYNTPGAGGTGNTGGTAGSTGNSTITLTVPNTGSTGNNFAEQSADMTSNTSCSQVSASNGVQVSCTVTCTNRGSGAAVDAFCAVANAATLPPGATVACAPVSASLAVNGALSCTVGFYLPAGGSASVVGGTGSVNDINGGTVPSGGNNPSSAAVGAPALAVPTLGALGYALLLLSIFGLAAARVERQRD